MSEDLLSSGITTWKCSAPPYAVVDVLQSCEDLLRFITSTGAGGTSDGRPSPPPTPSNNRRLLILFPGNPGVVHFYEEFVRRTSETCATDVLVMGLAGHSFEDHNSRRLFSLQDQIEVADQFTHAVLDSVSVKKYDGNVFLAGHSIGGYIALNLLSRHREQVKLYFGLCPVLSHIMRSPNGQSMFFWGVPVLQWIAAALGSLLALLPLSVRRFIVQRHGPTVNTKLQDIVARSIGRTLLLNIFYMSFDEYRCVLQPDKFLLRHVQEKMCLYYVPGDGWAPPAYAEEVRSVCPRLRSYIMEEDAEVPHAWCLQHNDIVIERAIRRFM